MQAFLFGIIKLSRPCSIEPVFSEWEHVDISFWSVYPVADDIKVVGVPPLNTLLPSADILHS